MNNKLYVFTFDKIEKKWRSEYEGTTDEIPSNYNSNIPVPNAFYDMDYLDVEDEYFDEKVYQVIIRSDNYENARNDFVDFLMMVKTSYELFNLYH